MARSAVLLVQNGRIACIERRGINRLYYVIPGGKIEPGESAEQAAIREIKEELGVDIQLGPLAAIVMFGERHQSYFWGSITGGVFGTDQGAELSSAIDSPRGSYLPVWLPIAALPDYDLRPHELGIALTEGRLVPGQPTLTLYELRNR